MTTQVSILLLCAVVAARGASPQAQPWEVTAREPDASRWESTFLYTNPLTAKVEQRKESYIEVATGANFLNETTGAYEPARQQWDVFADGIVAQYGRHKVILAKNINQGGAVDLLTPDGIRLVGTPTGIGIYDPDDGKQILIAEIRDAIPERGGPGEIYFRNCFAGVRASVRFTFRRSGFSQEVLLEQKLDLPPRFSERSRLECYTVFAPNTPAPRQTLRILRKETDPARRAAMVEPDITDAELDFGEMRIRLGKSFLTGADNSRHRIPVAKQWLLQDGTPVLIEAMEFRAIQPLLANLQAAVPPLPHPVLLGERRFGRAHAQVRLWDEAGGFHKRLASVSASAGKALELARLAATPRALIVDYETVLSTADMVFRGNQTYYCSNDVYLTGVTRLEGGTVIKFGTAYMTVSGDIQCLTTASAPAFFTSKDDNTIGATISGSTGNPVPASNFVTYLNFPNGSGTDLKHIHMRFADFGVWYDFCGENPNILTHATFYRCRTAIWSDSCYFTARNILIYDSEEAIVGHAFNGSIEHLTLNVASRLMDASSGPSTLALTNSILCRMTNWGTLSGDVVTSNSIVVTTNTAIFQTVGGGSHYLAEIPGRSLRNAGTTNVAILSDLRERTTYPPILRTGTLSGYAELGRVVPRDDDGLPDLGFAYPAVDWAVNTLAMTNGTLVLTNGAAIATYGPYGFWLQDNSKLVSGGTPLQPNHIFRAYAAQENPTNWGVSLPGTPYTLTPANYSNGAPSASFRFTHLYVPAGGGAHFEINTPGWDFAHLEVRDSEFSGGTISLFEYVDTNRPCAFTNNLFQRCTIYCHAYGNRYFYNNLFAGSILDLIRLGGTWVFKDNVFSGGAVYDAMEDLTHSHNAYVNTNGAPRLMPTNSTDVVLTNFTFQSGLLGYWYQYSTNFYEKGSRVAPDVGLYHFTCRTNQQKAATNLVSLGYHYVAMSGQLPANSDADLAADWFEDRDGDGSVDPNEPDPADSDSDDDGVDDYTELLHGRNPRAGFLNDTNGLLNLKVFTPLR